MSINRLSTLIVFLLFTVVFFSVTLPYQWPAEGIDAGWTQALAMAVDKDFVFGKDFVFNYGPLGYLNTGIVPQTVSVWALVAFQLLLLAHYLFLCWLGIRHSKRPWLVGFLALIIFLPWGFFSDTTFTLFYFLLLWLLLVWKYRIKWGLVAAALLTVLIFFIKLNLSLPSYLIFYLSVVYFAFSKRISWLWAAAILTAQVLLTYVFSIALQVNVPSYLLASLKIIDAYQDAMAVNLLANSDVVLYMGATVVLLLLPTYLIWQHRRHFWQWLYLYLLVAAAWFLSFKQSFTAIAHYNVFGYFLFFVPLALLFYLFTDGTAKRHFGWLFIVVLGIQLIITQQIRWSMGEGTWKGYALTFPPNEVAKQYKEGKASFPDGIIARKNPLNYFNTLARYDAKTYRTSQPTMQALHQLPPDVLAKIGNQSVDIMPWQIPYLYFNGLNYSPRPVIQTYQANSQYLAELNGTRYAQRGPDFVLATVASFREQHPYWVDRNAYEQLYANYEPENQFVTQSDSLVLFRKKTAKPVAIKADKVTEGTVQLNQKISIPATTEPLYLKANIEYSLLGKLARFIYQPPYLYATVTYATGQEATFRIPPPILKGGILLKKVTTHQEFVLYHQQRAKSTTTIVAIRFWPQYSKGFRPLFSYQIEKSHP